MHRTSDFELRASGDDIYLDTGIDQWRLVFSSVRRIGPDWFVHVVALGPRVCAFTVRISSPPNDLTNARRILGVIAKSLHAGDLRRHVFLEVG